ncbi:esterase [Aquiflexum sp. TKW24L]|uniref:alpha/beta fold hydrolase n=1 Tax=Aquiflexum sp. TKW24L TaxID=2942212 RepID=UPI0020BE3437|nr:alpha/beta fold hydrolase [Aquiflexum sp. TKW24L]MCL6258131.1 esterase [Aquiflexum sp. TKW24L]
MQDQFDIIKFDALDGFQCNLWHFKKSGTTKGPVLLVHGAGVRANIFNAPTEKNIIQALAEDGYDVWLENWRASIDLEPNEWNLDVVADNDHPAAVRKIVELTGKKEIKAIIHCQGSTSFMISYVKGLLPEVKTIISNAVSLHPVVPKFSIFKINVLVPIVKMMFDYLNPQWGLHAPDFKTKMLRNLVKFTHPENDTMVGKFVSFTYGSGFPALWLLENLNEETKNWIQQEFANVPLTFFQHIQKCIRKGVLIPYNSNNGQNYASVNFNPEARIILFGGMKNLCFLPDSQQNTFDYLEKVDPGVHQLYLLENYSHLDVFFGKNSHVDVFPLMIAELNKP